MVTGNVPAPPLVLAVSGDPERLHAMRTGLPRGGFRVREATSAAEGLSAAAQFVPEVVLLDPELADASALEVVRRLRAWSTAPILILGGRCTEAERVEALDAGANDVVPEPCGAAELAARIRVTLRAGPARGAARAPEVFVSGELRVDLPGRKVFVQGDEVRVTATEYRLLLALIQDAGEFVPHEELLRRVWGPNASGRSNYLRVRMTHLRQKLDRCSNIFETKVGVGYRILTRSGLADTGDVLAQLGDSPARRLLFDDNPQGLALIDADCRVVAANRRFVELLGYSEHELRALHPWSWDLTWPDRDAFLRRFPGPPQDSYVFETRVRRKDGAVRRLVVRSEACRRPALGAACLLVCDDVTEDRRTEIGRVLREEAFRALAEAASDPIVRYDRVGRRVFVNPAFEALAGRPASELLGRTPHQAPSSSPDVAHDILRHVELVVKTNTPSKLDARWADASGAAREYVISFVPEHGGAEEVTSVLALSRRLDHALDGEASAARTVSMSTDGANGFGRK